MPVPVTSASRAATAVTRSVMGLHWESSAPDWTGGAGHDDLLAGDGELGVVALHPALARALDPRLRIGQVHPRHRVAGALRAGRAGLVVGGVCAVGGRRAGVGARRLVPFAVPGAGGGLGGPLGGQRVEPGLGLAHVWWASTGLPGRPSGGVPSAENRARQAATRSSARVRARARRGARPRPQRPGEGQPRVSLR